MKVCRRARFWKNGLARKRERFDNGGMAMGTRKQQERQEGLWIATDDLPRSGGHPFHERLNELLAETGFDSFVEERCRRFYAAKMGRPSLAPGVYFRLLLIGYFEGLDSERGIGWRAADSLGLRRFLRVGLEEAPPDHSTISRTRRLIDVETHREVFTWVLGVIAEKELLQGKTVGIDATTLEANAALRSIVRRDSGESYQEFLTKLAKESGIATPTREDLARLDRKRKKKKTSNKEWKNPHDEDARIAKMKDGWTHLAHKVEHAVDLETGAVVAVTVQGADQGDTTTVKETFIEAAEQLEAVGEEAAADERMNAQGLEEVVTDKGYHSGARVVDLQEIGVRSYIPEPKRTRRHWQGDAGELAALVGIEDLRPAMTGQRVVERLDAKVRVQAVRQPPGQHMPARPIHDRHQVKEAAPHRDVADAGAPDMVRPLDRQTFEQIGVDPVPGMRIAGAWRPVDRLKPHQAHQTTGPATADAHPLKAQMTNHLTGAVERMLQEQLIDAPHQRKALRAFALGRVIEPGSPDL